jgi:predicted CXXCH cytochrome family protein
MQTPRIVIALLLLGWAVTAQAAKPATAPANDDCLTCHSEKDAKRSDGKSVFVAGAKFATSVHGNAGVACVDCHSDLANTADFPHAARLKKVDCASCHDGAGASHPFHPEIARAAREKKEPQVACADCHGTHEVTAVNDAAFRFARSRQAQACGDCHEDTSKHFLTSDHGKAFTSGEKPAPACVSCHRNAITSGSGLSAGDLKKAQERLCLSCHLYDESVKSKAAPTAGFIASFQNSVHGRALKRGDARAPGCADCHGAHDERRGMDTSSFVNKMQVQQVCAKCHASENLAFTASVHGSAIRKGNKDAPACTDCHGEHSILSPKDPRSPVAAANVSTQVCSPCHASLRLTEKWNLPRDRTRTFSESYHGLASRGGVVGVANCASCHGSHDILPSSNPASRVNRANMAATCGTAGCHPGANKRFALGNVHVTGTAKESPLIYWIATIYIVLILGTIGGMLAHNALDFVRKSRRQLAIRRGEIPEEPAGHALYLRMTVSERFQHGALAVSFIVLVVTGFMLRYPESWWVLSIRRVWPRVFDLRSLTHRVAGVVMVAASLYHVAYLSLTKRGRQLLRDLWWRKKDVADVAGTLRYNLGLSREKPRYDRFSYIEKAEYWALVWGTLVMAATGTAMWFDNTFIGLLSKLGYDVSRTIHFYEAWLATLAILVWHIYFVIFNPDAYPMNLAWLTGKLSEKEMEEEHPVELDRIRAAEAKEEVEAPVAPSPKSGILTEKPEGSLST